jgi:hypothetical protein
MADDLLNTIRDIAAAGAGKPAPADKSHEALERFRALLRAAAPDLDPAVRADIEIAAIDYAHERTMAALARAAPPRERS